MSASAIALQKALFASLSADADLASLMDGVRLYDHAPVDARLPYITFGRTSLYDWSTDTDGGTEHQITLHAWSKDHGKLRCLQILDRLRVVLHDAGLALDGQQLVNLRVGSGEVRYEADDDVQHGLLRLRAVTEPA